MADSDNAKAGGAMVLRAENLIKRYGKRTVVNNVSINVHQGEIVGLLVETVQERPHRFILPPG